MMKPQESRRVHNTYFTSPEHVVPQVALAILHARDPGLKIPIVYNTLAFDCLGSLELMDGLVDISLSELKVGEEADEQAHAQS